MSYDIKPPPGKANTHIGLFPFQFSENQENT